MTRILSWNVNGLRGIRQKGFKKWFKREAPDILCLQETKAGYEDVPKDLRHIKDYVSYFSSPIERKGYSGVATYTRRRPMLVEEGMGIERFDVEGRMQSLHFQDFVLINVYFPNGKSSHDRLIYKLDFYEAFLEYILGLRDRGIKVIFCGDVNTAHEEIDIARPKANSSISGFLPEERAWIDRLIGSGFIDTFREFDKSPERYTWWDLKTGARERNVGWRIDYFFISADLRDRLVDAFILSDVPGSDHCPIGMSLRD